jgi:hypothetical protein
MNWLKANLTTNWLKANGFYCTIDQKQPILGGTFIMERNDNLLEREGGKMLTIA